MRRTDRALASASTGYGIGRRAAPRQSQRQRWIEDVKDSPNFALTLCPVAAREGLPHCRRTAHRRCVAVAGGCAVGQDGLTPTERSAVIRVRRWWPMPVLLATSLVVQKALFESRYDVSGHAAEHLSSASVAFFAFALVAILLYVTPLARRQPLVLVTSAMWLFSTVLVLVGNVRVVDAPFVPAWATRRRPSSSRTTPSTRHTISRTSRHGWVC